MLLSVLYVRYRDVAADLGGGHADAVLRLAGAVRRHDGAGGVSSAPYLANPIAAILTEMRARDHRPDGARRLGRDRRCRAPADPGRDRGRPFALGCRRSTGWRRASPSSCSMERSRSACAHLRPRERRRRPGPEPSDWRRATFPSPRAAAQPIARRLLDRLRPEDVEAVEAVARRRGAPRCGTQASPPIAPTSRSRYGVHHRVPARARAHRPDGRRAAAGGARDGPRRRSRPAATTTRPTWSPRRSRVAGVDLGDVRRGLDFGCSSGRALRPLVGRATRTSSGTAWTPTPRPSPGRASTCPERVRRVSQRPAARAFPTAHFDLVYAISIWSHFGERSARAWLDERPPHRQRPAATSCSPSTAPQSIAHDRSARRAPAVAARGDRARAPPARVLVRAGVRQRRAITASCTRSGAPRS